MAPKYIRAGRASKESDVYSFGVVLLEIATGRNSSDCVESSQMGMVEWIWHLYGSALNKASNASSSLRGSNAKSPKQDACSYSLYTYMNTSHTFRDARAYVGAVEFNSISYLCHVGRATYAKRVHIWDSETSKLTDFTTHFSISIDTGGRSLYAAGLAFYLAPFGFQIPPNSAGGFLGLFNSTTSDSSQNRIVLVEFDSFPNPEWDPPAAHVGINNNSIASSVYTPWNASFHSGDIADVSITYNATTKNMSVSWTYQQTSDWQEFSTLSYQIDLMKILPEWVSVGFSAATSDHLAERHQLLSWEFSSSLNTEETNEKKVERIRLEVGIAASVGILIAGAVIAYYISWTQKYKNNEEEEAINLASIDDDLEQGSGPKRFSINDLLLATKKFSKDRKLGEGGFGAVYKGYSIDFDMPIAVKRISRGSKQGKKEYITEVKIISQLKHRNLVQLIGWCHDKGELLLVYELMPNGSLDSHLFGKTSSPLSWAVRYEISLGLASALLYLHEEWEQCVVHRDIKASNVMLDSSFNVKLGDFGLAKLMNHELVPETTTVLAGTLGYMAPEYISTSRASKESDVYSFGVVALEITTGRKAIHPLEQNFQTTLVEWIWKLYGEGDILSAVDKRLHIFDEKQAECLMIVGLWCAHPDSTLRPSIRQAIQVLKFEAPMPNLPAKMPIAVYSLVAHSISLNMIRFDPNDNTKICQGDATASVGAIESINRDTYTYCIGWATYANTVPLWDSSTGRLSDFSTSFSFTIDTMGRTPYGHGLAFFLALVEFQITPNSASGFLGLLNTTTMDSSSNQIVMVEFNSFKNVEWDPSDVEDHVGVNKNSLSSDVYTRWNASFHSGDTADVQITYNATNNLSGLGRGKEYVTEVKTISQLRHRNRVQLIGWCHDRGAFLLAYEFMPNGCLDSLLFGKKGPLAWSVRYKISLGLASALHYLHEEWEQCVVHRDIKSCNIMLDSSFGVKLGDFGLARLMDHELGPKTTGLAGTSGYLAPEYISTGRAGKESDVYSFGVVPLEIATGKKSANPIKEYPGMGLVEWVWDLYRRGQVLSRLMRNWIRILMSNKWSF
ncbi:hypothetical protein Ddye_009699 [Dipteronia dyeriana]|uniref:Protein kinase domain-containing protein n=1 Tax=Dipteronia dyeriana TaxID=168575 RepID=A0AAD9XC88_9ROSI|nr:hypothetical protein Ddye_009699 [Dipteronia dyeriana]